MTIDSYAVVAFGRSTASMFAKCERTIESYNLGDSNKGNLPRCSAIAIGTHRDRGQFWSVGSIECDRYFSYSKDSIDLLIPDNLCRMVMSTN